MQTLKKVAFVLGILSLLAGGIGYIFSTAYESEVKAFILEEINKNVATKIDVQNVEFSIFKKFPYASLEFKKINAEEVSSESKKGTLFAAQSIYLQFNLLDVINKNYLIKKIHVKDGIVNVRINKNGTDNYRFWKATKNENNKNLSVELENVKLEGVTFYVLNEYKKLDMAVEASKATFSGKFSSEKYVLNTNANVTIHALNQQDKSLVKSKDVVLKTALAIDQGTHFYEIKKGSISIEDLLFNLSGSITKKEGGMNLNIKSKGKELEVGALFSLLPEKHQKSLRNYDAKGFITYDASITGLFSAAYSPNVIADFSIEDGKIEEKRSNQLLDHISMKGSYSNGTRNSLETSKIVLNDLSGEFGAGHISGDYTVSNFLTPYIDFNSKAKLDVNNLKAFLKLDTIEVAEGNIELDLRYKGYIKDLGDIKAKELQKLDAQGSIKLIGVNLKLDQDSRTFHNINGSIQFNNSVQVTNLTAAINSSKLNLSGTFYNLLAYLFIPEEKLKITGSIHSSMLLLDELLIEKKSNFSDTTYSLNLPKNVQLQLTAKIDTFRFKKFKANKFTGRVLLKKERLTATQVHFNALSGNVSGSLVMDASPKEKVKIKSLAKIRNIDARALFTQFGNFGQNYFLAKNIQGKATTDVNFKASWSKQLQFNPNDLVVSANLVINDGAVIDYKPILALSRFIRVEELKHISFSELRTQIEIKNQVISFSKTDVTSSALDLTFSGTHSFDHEIDYKFEVLLSDLLWKKAKNKKENSEFGYVQDDGLGRTSLFLRMQGTTEDYKIKYDTKGLRESFKEDLKKEKQTLKKILKEEFNWFKKDTSLHTKQEEPTDNGLQIEWEEDDDYEEPSPKKETPAKKPKTKKGLGKFLEKITQPDEEEYEESDEF